MGGMRGLVGLSHTRVSGYFIEPGLRGRRARRTFHSLAFPPNRALIKRQERMHGGHWERHKRRHKRQQRGMIGKRGGAGAIEGKCSSATGPQARGEGCKDEAWAPAAGGKQTARGGPRPSFTLCAQGKGAREGVPTASERRCSAWSALISFTVPLGTRDQQCTQEA